MLLKTERYGWLDYAKTIGIFLVVVGHMPNNTPQLYSFLWTFHVPLFFFISGFLYKETSNKEFLVKKTKRILLPYIYLYLVTVLYTCLRWSIADWNLIWKHCIGITWEGGSYPAINPPLWFPVSLFMIELLFHFIIRRFPLVFPLFLIFAVEFYAKNNINLILNFAITLFGLNYFIIGYLVRKYDLISYISNKIVILLVLLVVSTAATLWYTSIGNVWFAGTYFIISLSGAVAGILMIISLSFLLDKLFGRIKIIAFYSKNTLLILGLHLSSMPFAYDAILKLGLKSPTINSLLAALLSILFLTPLIILFSRFLPFVGGNERVKQKH